MANRLGHRISKRRPSVAAARGDEWRPRASAAHPASGGLAAVQRLAGNRAASGLIQRWKDQKDRIWDYESLAGPPAAWNMVRGPAAAGLVFIPGPDTPPVVKAAFEANKGVTTKFINDFKTNKIDVTASADAVKEAPKPKRPDFPARTTTGVFLGNPKVIRYSQNSISYSFSVGRDNVDTLAAKLKAGTVTADKIPPLELVQYTHPTTGNVYIITLDNRRLCAFKRAGIPVRCQWATKKVEDANQWKFTGGSYGAETIEILR